MTVARETKGFKLLAVFLVQSRFEFLPGLGEEAMNPQDLTKDIEISFNALRDERRKLPELGQSLSVTLIGKAGGKPAWKASSAFVGLFKYDNGNSEVNLEQALQSANAILYGFAREHLADTLRRANLPLVLPPIMNFVPSKPEVSEEKVPSSSRNEGKPPGRRK